MENCGASQIYGSNWVKGEEPYSLIQNPVKHLPWNFLRKGPCVGNMLNSQTLLYFAISRKVPLKVGAFCHVLLASKYPTALSQEFQSFFE